jgi:hypothetical protein
VVWRVLGYVPVITSGAVLDSVEIELFMVEIECVTLVLFKRKLKYRLLCI